MPSLRAVGASSSMQKIMRTPRSLDLEITSRCNLRCRYCYFFDNSEVEYRELPTEEWLQFFDECGRCAIMDVTLAGGEPFMRRDLPQLIEGIVRNRIRFSLLSNGTLVSDKIAAFIADTGRCDSIQISIDGSSAEMHDAYRGQGSFAKAIQGIHTLQHHGIAVAIRVTIHHQNVRYLKEIARFLLEDLKLSSFSTNSASYLGSCRQHADDVLLTIEERELAMRAMSEISEYYNGRISASAGPLAEARTWQKMAEARQQKKPPFPNGGYLTGCRCPSQKIAVRADGTIVPCSMLAHMELGRINHDSLAEVWQQSPSLNQLRQRYSIPLTDFEHCAGCPYIPYCTGNCPALAYTLIGQVNHPSPNSCLRRFLEAGGNLSRIVDANEC